jgi:type II restriction enzyme
MMLLDCDMSAAEGYKSQLQIARILSENWMEANGYCLSCDSDRLKRTSANTKASDFVCELCSQTYELKAFRRGLPRILPDGAYSALISRVRSGAVPTLMLLERNEAWKIQNLTAIHHLFLTPDVIEKRKPLSQSARRAGWVGCRIRLDLIAPDARIDLVRDRVPIDPQAVRAGFQRFNRLKEIAPDSRGWTTLTLRIVRSLKESVFTLGQLYQREGQFATSYPGNRNIRAKVRQQLQVLRDLGYIEFRGHGSYRLLL